MIVMKFGGTSVEDAGAIRNVVQIVKQERKRTPLVVVSACAGVTNALIDIAEKGSQGAVNEALSGVAALRHRHWTIAQALLDAAQRAPAQEFLSRQFDELEKLVQSISVLKELTPRALDQIMAFGERVSARLLWHALLQEEVAACVIDAQKVLVTNDEHTRAAPLFDRTELKAKEFFLPRLLQGNVVVTQGFIAATTYGVATTLGRGGSDYSAAIFGAALDAEEIQIWTDVDGILTADPSILPEARPIKEMTFNEAAELAYFGAKVLHPSTILPALQKNIPVRVLNSKRRNTQGTRITRQSRQASQCIVKSVAYKEGITVITIESTRMLMAYGFLARVFEVFARHKKSIDVVATSEVGVSLTVNDDTDLGKIVLELREFADVSVERDKAVCCVVGENMKYTKGIAARVFAALDRAGVNVELISHGGSKINLTFVISQEQIHAAVKTLHEHFFSNASELADVFY